MRLTQQCIHLIRDTVLRCWHGLKIHLLGSRLNDCAKGRDIDLLIGLRCMIIEYHRNTPYFHDVRPEPNDR